MKGRLWRLRCNLEEIIKVKVWIGFVWLRIRRSRDPTKNSNEQSGSKMVWNFWSAERLSSSLEDFSF
jgi:hypothetical protein